MRRFWICFLTKGFIGTNTHDIRKILLILKSSKNESKELTAYQKYGKIFQKRDDGESRTVKSFREPCSMVEKGRGSSDENGSRMVYRSLFEKKGLGYNRFACYSDTA